MTAKLASTSQSKIQATGPERRLPRSTPRFPRVQETSRRLIGWQKAQLNPGESRQVSLKIQTQYFSIFDVDKDQWSLVPGEYTLFVGGSSENLPLRRECAWGNTGNSQMEAKSGCYPIVDSCRLGAETTGCVSTYGAKHRESLLNAAPTIARAPILFTCPPVRASLTFPTITPPYFMNWSTAQATDAA